MEKLNDNYDLSAKNMLNITDEYVHGKWKISSSKFYTEDGTINIKVLVTSDRQIFQMNDGKFILEIENDYYDNGSFSYYYSTNINDLL